MHIKIDMDGGITVHSMAAEIGQGSDTVLAQCVAEVLGVDRSMDPREDAKTPTSRRSTSAPTSRA